MRLISAAIAVLALVAGAGAQGNLPGWKLGASPQVTIGGDGSPRTDFLNVDATWRLSGGRIAVVNRNPNEIRIFDARGKFLSAFGRQGQGPGEFEFMRGIARSGDTVMIYDGGQRRLSRVLLSAEPRLVGEQLVTVEAPEGEFWVAGLLPDGRWMTFGNGMPDVQRKSGVFRIPGYVGIAGAALDGKVKWEPPMPDGDAFITDRPLSLSARAFGAAMASAVSGSAVWYGDGATDSLIRLDLRTNTRKAIHLPMGAAITQPMIDAARAQFLDRAKNRRDTALNAVRFSPEYLPKRLPTYIDFVAGTRGELWVQRGEASQVAPGEYIVLSSAGVPVARLTTPAGFRIRQVGNDYAIGVHRDDDGVETIRLYALRR